MDANHPWLKEIHPEPLIRTLVEAIRIPSLTGSEREMGEYCAERMRRAGLEVAEETLRPESPNFVGRLAGGRPGLSLCYHAHTDTVPPGDAGTWTKDPFAGVVENGRVFGRGACDVKQDIAVMLTVAKILAEHRDRLSGSLVLCFTSGEEIADSAGTQHVIDSGRLGDVDFAVVGEQTECRVGIAHRGGLHLLVTVKGESAHSSIADRAGVNAIYKMSRVVETIRTQYLPDLAGRSHPYLPAPTANVAIIRGGVKPNMVPDRCEMVMGRRTLPHETPEQVRDEVDAILGGLRREDPELDVEVEVTKVMAPFETDPQNPHVRSLLRAASEVLGAPQEPMGYVAGTDARLFPPAGIPAVVFGPGEFSQAHTADESVSIDQVVQATRILALLAADLLE
ncbi:MAG: M20 family metallopeptidase [Nitrospinota bacterium]|nr:M20 family metallopeptidase [Nitrospinota bacterium]